MPRPEADTPLAWFLGPKAENGQLFEELMLEVVRDYLHWRRNYFPADPILVSRAVQRDLVPQTDALAQQLHTLLADLRRNFPFYSPRYFGHQLSDTLMPSMLGYLAGMLFNPNNVTPGAAPVTTEMEILASGALLTMLGFRAPPGLPPAGEDAEAFYRRADEQPYGWAHLTSGGTVANIEALWFARQVRYATPAIKAVAQARGLRIPVQVPGRAGPGEPCITELDDRALLLLPTAEAVALLSRYIRALKGQPEHANLSGDRLGRLAWVYLNNTPVSLSRGIGTLFTRHPPAVLVAGTRHYSIAKAADITGIGAGNIVQVATDPAFRMRVDDLEHRILGLLREGRIPLAVIASAGTTEEGSVDPVHEIAALRSRLEREHGVSFWLHIDGAWGGYIRSLFSLEAADKAAILAKRAGAASGVEFRGDLDAWHARLCGDAAAPETGANPRAGALRAHLGELLEAGDLRGYTAELSTIIDRWSGPLAPASETLHHPITDRETADWVAGFVADSMPSPMADRPIDLSWPPDALARAFQAFHEADSITVDPHKLGYAPYPCGCVAFRDDRVRMFVQQRAAYVSATHPDPLLHVPPRHTSPHGHPSEPGPVMIDSFSPFILEGSKPGAAAAALWLSIRSVPLTTHGHGLIIRQALLGARRLYEWLHAWHGFDPGVRFVPLTPGPPDTSIVTFAVMNPSIRSLPAMNALGRAVHQRFSIQAELGQRDAAYAQPFFLSHTHMEPQEYAPDVLAGFFRRCGLPGAEQAYQRHGLMVLRATVMSPYVEASRRLAGQDFTRLFVHELARAAHDSRAARGHEPSGSVHAAHFT